MTTKTLVQKIAAASVAVGGTLAKDKTNTYDNYQYVSADAILTHCGQALAEQGIVVLPTITHEAVEHVQVGSKFRYDATVEFAFVITDGEAELHAPWVGKGSDARVPDKALYKAMTSGHRYFLAKFLNVGAGNEDGEHENIQPQNGQKRQTNGTPAMIGDGQKKYMHKLGVDMYGEKWDEERHRLVKYITAGRTESANELTGAQADTLIVGMTDKLKEQQTEEA